MRTTEGRQMTIRLRSMFGLAGLAIALAACADFREAMEGHQRILAQVDGHHLTIDRAARILATASEEVAPATPRVVDPFTDLWIGYTLLAQAFAAPDSFESVDIRPVAQLALDQELVWQLHGDVIEARAALPEGDLRRAYEREQPFARVQAEHILIRVPPSAEPSERDSLERLARGIRARALAGEDFAELARRYSDDPTTASRGGDLGWIERGDLVSELDAVLFELPIDSVGELVRTRLGYHIVRVRDQRSPSFEEARQDYRGELVNRRIEEAERAYIDSLFESADLRFSPAGPQLARALAGAPELERLSPWRRRARLATYDGGALTVGELADYVVSGGTNARSLFVGQDTSGVRTLLRELVRNELLVRAARDLGYDLAPEVVDSIGAEARRDMRMVATLSGMDRDSLRQGPPAIVTTVDSTLSRALTRRLSPRPMERVSTALERGHTIVVHPARFRTTARRLAELRRGERGPAATAGEPRDTNPTRPGR